MVFFRCGWILFVTTEYTAELSVCIGVHGWGWPIIPSRVFVAGTASLEFMNIVPFSVSQIEDIMARIIWYSESTAPFFGGTCLSLDTKKWPLVPLLWALGLLKQDAPLHMNGKYHVASTAMTRRRAQGWIR